MALRGHLALLYIDPALKCDVSIEPPVNSDSKRPLNRSESSAKLQARIAAKERMQLQRTHLILKESEGEFISIPQHRRQGSRY